MTNTTVPYLFVDSKTLAKRLILLASIASASSACGVKIGQGVVIGTTSFLEEANKGAFTSDFQDYRKTKETISEEDRSKLSVRLAEVD